MYKILKTVTLFLLLTTGVQAETVISTSFEKPEFSEGPIHGQQNWAVQSGSGYILVSQDSVGSGEQSVNFIAENSTLFITWTPYTSQTAGPTGVLYLDVWIRVDNLENKYFAISGYDLFNGSEKRDFVFEFNTPSSNQGILNVYDGSSKQAAGTWTEGVWNRISAKIDYSKSSYQVIFNNGDCITASFRETYTPPGSSVRIDGEKQFHQLRFNLGYDSAVGIADVFMDDLYIGTSPIPGISFDPAEYFWTVNIEQPEIGIIDLEPEMESYPDSMWVTAFLNLPRGYRLTGWTGDLAGNDTIISFQVTQNMTIGAGVAVDPLNPPEVFDVTVIQPDTGFILLEPNQDFYYAHTEISASAVIPAGFLFGGWTGDLSGNEPETSWRILKDMTIGAEIVEDTIPATIYTVSSPAEFKSRCQSSDLHPGDIIELTDGNYNTGGITLTARGTANKPITIRSQNRGGAVLGGESYFNLKESEYVTIEGFEFISEVYTVIKLEACHHIRITRNIFHLTESEDSGSKWLLIGGIWNDPSKISHHNRVDYNLFENKQQSGNFITIDGGDNVSQYDVIAYNHFRNMGPRRENEMESIRVGVSGMSLTDGFTLIEHNLFEDCDGDPEIISIKSCKDTIRFNTFRECQGTVCLRQGHGSVVDANFFFGNGKEGTGGVRLYGRNHTIVNNYFENLAGHTWDAAITLTNGDVISGAENAHWQIQNANILMNTFVNNQANIEIGYPRADQSWNKIPQNLFFYGNLLYDGINPAVVYLTPPGDITWKKNMAYDPDQTPLGIEAGEDEIWNINPLLQESHGFFRPSEESPAISYLDTLHWTTDLLGRKRTLPGDGGALESDGTGAVVNYPLTGDHVGPYAETFPVSILNNRWKDSNHHIPEFFSLSGYPNPFNGSIQLDIYLPAPGFVTVDVLSVNGKLVRNLDHSFQPSGTYYLSWTPENLGSSVYFVRVKILDKQKVLKILYLK